jgi:hypothetical protein
MCLANLVSEIRVARGLIEAPVEEVKPSRWLHVRHRGGFTEEQWASFQAHCRYFEGCANALLTNWVALGQGERTLRYVFFPPELSEDRTIATLPLAGEWSLGTRAAIENGLSGLLWGYLLRYMPIEDFAALEEGLTEPSLADPSKLATNWRPAQRSEEAPPQSEPPYAVQLSIALANLSRIGVPSKTIAPALFRLLWLVGAPVPPPLFLPPAHLFAGVLVFLSVLFALGMAALAPWLSTPLPSLSRLLVISLLFGVTGATAVTVMYRRQVRLLNLTVPRRERPDA